MLAAKLAYVRRLQACLDKVALRIEPEQVWRPARDLATQYERGVEADITGCQVLAIALINFSHGVRYQHSGIEHGPTPYRLGVSSLAFRCLRTLMMA